jgi:hypothetical protein
MRDRVDLVLAVLFAGVIFAISFSRAADAQLPDQTASS